MVIACHNRRYVFISIPRTASSSIRAWLRKRCGGKKISRDHGCVVPKRYQGHLIFAVVRDPYERCYSLWIWDVLKHGSGMNFEEYLEFLIERKDAPLNTYITQDKYIRTAGVKRILHFEALLPSLERLSFIGDLRDFPHRRKTKEHDTLYRQHYTERTKELLLQYCKEDFELGYQI